MKNWYKDAHNFCKEQSERFNVSLEAVVGILAYLSPQKHWNLNKLQTIEFLETHNVTNGMINSRQLQGCTSIINGDICFLDLISERAMKIRNFYHNILDPTDENHVTVDTHMVKAYLNKYPKSKVITKDYSKVFSSKRKYQLIANWIKREAKAMNVIPCEAQAILWTIQRS